MWPQFRSPLVWDVFAVSTYATVSLLFWYVGLIPDLATLRDRSKKRIAQILACERVEQPTYHFTIPDQRDLHRVVRRLALSNLPQLVARVALQRGAGQIVDR